MAGSHSDTAALTRRYRVQVLDRSFDILDALAGAPHDLGAAELVASLHLHKSTIHRLLAALERRKIVRRNPEGKYCLGLKMLEMGGRAFQQLDIGVEATPFLRRLVDQSGESAHISVLGDNEMVSIAHVPGRWSLRVPATVGRRSPTYCTGVGKALLAFLPEAELDALLSRTRLRRLTRRTITTAAALKAELTRVRRRGYAFDDEEREVGLRCIGAPVRDYTGWVTAAVSIAGPSFRIQRERLPELSRLVISVADELSSKLGYLAPTPRSES